MPQGTKWKEKPDGTIVFEPEGATKGFIFYPGGKVEYTAYIPLMQACAEEGILCVLVEMPFNLAVLSVFGSEDRVMSREKYEESKANLPNNFTEYIIDGGCHAYFGMYGAQDGDGKPTVTNEEQIRLTVENIVKIME